MNWSDAIKTEARGSDDEDLGEVKEAGGKLYSSTNRLIRLSLPKDQLERYDSY